MKCSQQAESTLSEEISVVSITFLPFQGGVLVDSVRNYLPIYGFTEIKANCGRFIRIRAVEGKLIYLISNQSPSFLYHDWVMFWGRKKTVLTVCPSNFNLLEGRSKNGHQLWWIDAQIARSHAQPVLVLCINIICGRWVGRGQSSSDQNLIVQVLKMKCSRVDSWVLEGSENSDERKLIQTAQTTEIKQKSFLIRQHGSSEKKKILDCI